METGEKEEMKQFLGYIMDTVRGRARSPYRKSYDEALKLLDLILKTSRRRRLKKEEVENGIKLVEFMRKEVEQMDLQLFIYVYPEFASTLAEVKNPIDYI